MSKKQSPSSNVEQNIEAQIEISKRLQVKWLEHMERLVDSGTITSTDLATLSRVLLHNGWSLDPKHLPKSIKDLMTKTLTLVDFGSDDADTGQEFPRVPGPSIP